MDTSKTVEQKFKTSNNKQKAESMSERQANIFICPIYDREKVDKGGWWMPWLTQAMKDVISCDKRWVGANDL